MEDPARPGGRKRNNQPPRETEEHQTDWLSRRSSPLQQDMAHAAAVGNFGPGPADLRDYTFQKVCAPRRSSNFCIMRGETERGPQPVPARFNAVPHATQRTPKPLA